MRKKDPILTRDQWIAAVILVLMVGAVSAVVHLVPQPSVAERQWLVDSLRRADSLDREMQRELRRDSLRRVWAERDSLRRDSLRMVWDRNSRHRRDSLRAIWAERDSLRRDSLHRSWHLRDSLRADSLHRTYHHVPKKDTVLELNSADTTDLMCLRGIGIATARRVVRLRTQLGGFHSVEQLEGIVPDTVWRHFTVDPSRVRRIRVNSCSIGELSRHPYLRFEQAKAIYELRRNRVRLRGIEDLRRLDCLDENELERLRNYLSFE